MGGNKLGEVVAKTLLSSPDIFTSDIIGYLNNMGKQNQN